MSDLRTTTEQRLYTGWRIATERQHPSRRWSQFTLAVKINHFMDTDYWTADRISTLERGVTKLPAEWVPAFAVVLGVTADELLGLRTSGATLQEPDSQESDTLTTADARISVAA